MKRPVAVALTMGLMFAASQAVFADGMMVPPDRLWESQRERAYINEPQQKAAIFYRDGEETLIISPSFSGPSGDFAWVVPVPSRPTVRTVDGALFHELARLSFPQPPVQYEARSQKSAALAGAAGVAVLERKDVGAFDVSVLSSGDSHALLDWLRENRYHVPDQALGPINAYVQEGWTFVASRIRSGSTGDGLNTGTLAPIRLTFPAKQPIYPMRLSSANPYGFRLLVYVLTPANGSVGDEETLAAALAPGSSHLPPGMDEAMRHRARFDPADSSEYPTLSKFSEEPQQIYALDAPSIPPASCTVDYAWNLPEHRKPVAAPPPAAPPIAVPPPVPSGNPDRPDPDNGPGGLAIAAAVLAAVSLGCAITALVQLRRR